MPLVFDPTASLLGIYPGDIAPTIKCAWVYSSSIVRSCKHWEQPKCPYTEDGESALGHPYTVENNVMGTIGRTVPQTWASLWLRQWRIRLQCGRPGFDPWVGKIRLRREQLPTPIFWPGEFLGLCSPWGHKELDTTERLSLSLSILLIGAIPRNYC